MKNRSIKNQLYSLIMIFQFEYIGSSNLFFVSELFFIPRTFLKHVINYYYACLPIYIVYTYKYYICIWYRLRFKLHR